MLGQSPGYCRMHLEQRSAACSSFLTVDPNCEEIAAAGRCSQTTACSYCGKAECEVTSTNKVLVCLRNGRIKTGII